VGIGVGTLRNWEQRRRKPEGSARVLLRVVEQHPEAVFEVVGGGPQAASGSALQPPVTAQRLGAAIDGDWAD
jgi:putative transcriptional regulator